MRYTRGIPVSGLFGVMFLDAGPHSSGVTALQIMPVRSPSFVAGTNPLIARNSHSPCMGLGDGPLAACLETCCANSGAGYAMYWEPTEDGLEVKEAYTTSGYMQELKEAGKSDTFAEANMVKKLALTDGGPVVAAYMDHLELFIQNVSQANSRHSEYSKLACDYGIEGVMFVPFKNGILEFGTSRGETTSTWTEMSALTYVMCSVPIADGEPTLPADIHPRLHEARKSPIALSDASYMMLWALDETGKYTVRTMYVPLKKREHMRRVFGDDETFCSKSREFKLPADGTGPVAMAAKEGKVVVVSARSGNGFEGMVRANLVAAAGLQAIHFVPSEEGVYEYGIGMLA